MSLALRFNHFADVPILSPQPASAESLAFHPCRFAPVFYRIARLYGKALANSRPATGTDAGSVFGWCANLEKEVIERYISQHQNQFLASHVDEVNTGLIWSVNAYREFILHGQQIFTQNRGKHRQHFASSIANSKFPAKSFYLRFSEFHVLVDGSLVDGVYVYTGERHIELVFTTVGADSHPRHARVLRLTFDRNSPATCQSVPIPDMQHPWSMAVVRALLITTLSAVHEAAPGPIALPRDTPAPYIKQLDGACGGARERWLTKLRSLGFYPFRPL